MKLKEQIESWINGSYSIDSNGFYNVIGDVNIKDWKDPTLPIKFGTVSGDFYCGYNQLTSLKGAPETVGGNFYCTLNGINLKLNRQEYLILKRHEKLKRINQELNKKFRIFV